MKVRSDFVTNSSSSSFILDLSPLSEEDKKNVKFVILTKYCRMTDQNNEIGQYLYTEEYWNSGIPLCCVVDYDGGDILNCFVDEDLATLESSYEIKYCQRLGITPKYPWGEE